MGQNATQNVIFWLGMILADVARFTYFKERSYRFESFNFGARDIPLGDVTRDQSHSKLKTEKVFKSSEL